MGAYGSMIIWVVVIAGMMFFMTRNQKKQQKQRQEQLNSMQVGSKVITIGGLHGVISEVDEAAGTVTLDCEGIFLVFNKAAISTVKAPESTVSSNEVQEEVVSEEVEVENTDTDEKEQ